MKDIWKKWNRFILNESSLSRLHKHITEHDCAVVTAFRNDPASPKGCVSEPPSSEEDGNVLAQNKSRNKELKAALLRKGYGVTRVDGSYIENFDDPDNRIEVSEESFFVVNLKDDTQFINTIENLGKMFCQDSVLIIPQGGTGSYLLGTNEDWPGLGRKESVGNFKGGEEAEFMSRVRKRPFVFKEVCQQETYSDLSKNARWAVTKISERVWGRLKK